MNEELNKIPISYMIYQSQRAIHQNLNQSFQEAGIPLQIEQWPVLVEIFNHNGLTQQELADKTRKDKTTLTRLIDTLEKKELVERRFDSNDRRKRLIFATQKVESLKENIVDVFQKHNLKLLNGVGNKRENETRKALLRFLNNMNWEFDFENIKCGKINKDK